MNKKAYEKMDREMDKKMSAKDLAKDIAEDKKELARKKRGARTVMHSAYRGAK